MQIRFIGSRDLDLGRSLLCALYAAAALATAAAAIPGSIVRPAPASASGSDLSVLVMGDSYSAGNGGGSYYGPAGCWRSPNNYADLYARALERSPYDQPTSYESVACSGDTTSAFFQTTHGRSPQLDSVSQDQDLILLTTGGDDANFGGIVKNCLIYALRDGAKCNSELSVAEQLLNSGTLEARVRHVLSAIHGRANPQATIALLGYPYLESDLGYRLPYGHNRFVAVGKWLRAIQQKGNALQQRVVGELDADDHTSSFVFVATEGLFAGHELSAMSSNPHRWFVEPLTDSSVASHETWYHPNPKGWSEEANLLLREPGIPKHALVVNPPSPPPAPSPPPSQSPPPSPLEVPVNTEAGVVSLPGGPLTVSVGQLGQCQSSYEGSGDNYFPPESSLGDCGFFLAFPTTGGGQPTALQNTVWGFDGLAGPREINPYTPVSQSPVTGNGSEASPYTQVTVFDLLDYEGVQDARVTEVTTYVNGATQFISTYNVKNTTTAPIYFRAIYAGDLYVGGEDFGTDIFESSPTRFVGGENLGSGAIGGFLEAPGLPWSSFAEGCWSDTSEEEGAEGRCSGASPSDYGIWHTVESSTEESQAFNESVEPVDVDDAVGVEWDQLREAGLPPGHEQAFTIINAFRP